MNARLLSAAVVVVVCVGSVSAQTYDAGFFAQLAPGTPVDGRPGCTWQWAQHTVGPWGGWFQACPDTPTEIDPSCLNVNPYANKDKASECAARYPNPRTARLTEFVVGHRYFFGYPNREMVVIALTRGYDGAEVVTYQWTIANGSNALGDVGACRNTMSVPSCGPWLPVEP